MHAQSDDARHFASLGANEVSRLAQIENHGLSFVQKPTENEPKDQGSEREMCLNALRPLRAALSEAFFFAC